MRRLTALIALLIFASASACFASPSSGPSQGDDRGHPALQLGTNKLTLQWGTLALAADFQPAAMTASAEDSEKWNELSAFHDVMSATFHPMEEGDFKPIRDRAAEMAAKGKQWADSKPPKLYDKPEIKTNVAKLAQESKALAALVAKKASDTQIKESLSALHDRFHEIVGLCRDAKKQST